MVEFLTMAVLFIRPIFSVVLSVLRVSVSSGQMGILYAVVALAVYAYIFYAVAKRKGKVKRSLMGVFAAILITLAALCVTSLLYEGTVKRLYTEILSFGSATAAAMLMAHELAMKDSLKKMGYPIPIFVLLITVVSFSAVVFGEKSAIGLTRTSNSIGYQSGAYYSAYALGLNLYYLTCYNQLEKYKWIDKLKPVFWVMPFLQFTAVLLSGGRGGLVLALILLCYFGFVNRKKLFKSRVFLFGLLSLFLIVGIFIWINRSSISTVGITRILSFLNNFTDSNRAKLWTAALDAFRDSPVVGNGIGSVFYKVGFYSHNLFTDTLCEGGIAGLLLLCCCLYCYVKNQLRADRADVTYRFVACIFIFGISLLSFSGYYITDPQIWFALTFMIVYRVKRKQRRKTQAKKAQGVSA